MHTPFFVYSLTLYFVIIVTAEIKIVDSGIGIFNPDDTALVFYVAVKNICKDDLELSVNMVQCCEVIGPDDSDCNSMTLIGGDMGVLPSKQIKNLTLIYPNLYLYNRHGKCTIEVIYRNQLKKREISADIHFDTTETCDGNEQKRECETIDLDYRENCNPVDCLVKYSGIISYFNPECKRCQKVPVCNSKIEGCFPDVAYSPYNNECGDLNIPFSRKDLKEMEHYPLDNRLSMINAICHYGTVTSYGECLCNPGWITSTNDEGVYEPSVAQHHLCNIQVGDWNCVNKSRIRITAILLSVLAITIISKLLLLMCLMTWCYRHFRGPEKTCAQTLDPNDPSIILCEAFDSQDKCHCHDLKTQRSSHKKPVKLHSQTVNISYYPCSPSAFSSMRTSMGSSKYSKSEPTIELSNTSTSATISLLDDDSEDSDSTGTLFCEDELRGGVAYGTYCEVDNDKESGEDAEEVEEEEDGNVDEVSQENTKTE
ncbi:hypothetical protein ABEB36_005667 [Hypothenemus hampei]|uniref:Uncharacterized protein n=1 Tax=Hypothenemus hampei TaxID=57062 RepID=A0ABD1EZ19_HYPHA